jgi:ABC-2 type transport system ATP-binding protein
VEIQGPQDSDLRAEIFRLMVQKGWTLLELRRDAQSLDAVFRDLTKGDEALDRGREWDEAQADVDEEGADDETDDEEEDDDNDSSDNTADSDDASDKKKEEG